MTSVGRRAGPIGASTILVMSDADAIATVDERVPVGDGELVVVRPASADAVLERDLARGAVDAPYWADLWPAAHALAEHVARRDLRGRRVIELGCGLGLPALAAARAGAHVVATDVSREALELVARSARANALAVATAVVDLADPDAIRALAAERIDLVLAADVLYEPGLPPLLARALALLLATGGEAVVAYPFAGQADELARSLTEAGLPSQVDAVTAPGRRGPTTIRLLRTTSVVV